MSPKEHSTHEHSCVWFFGTICTCERSLHNGAMVLFIANEWPGAVMVAQEWALLMPCSWVIMADQSWFWLKISVHEHLQALMNPPEHSLATMIIHDHGGMSTDKHLGELMSANEHSKNKSPKDFENSWALITPWLHNHENSWELLSSHKDYWALSRAHEPSWMLIINTVSEYLIKNKKKMLALIMTSLQY